MERCDRCNSRINIEVSEKMVEFICSNPQCSYYFVMSMENFERTLRLQDAIKKKILIYHLK